MYSKKAYEYEAKSQAPSSRFKAFKALKGPEAGHAVCPNLRTSTIWCRRRMKRSCNSRSPQQSTVKESSVVAKFFNERNNAL